jgi:hypothetical protein
VHRLGFFFPDIQHFALDPEGSSPYFYFKLFHHEKHIFDLHISSQKQTTYNLKGVNVKDMEVKTRVKKKMRDKKNSFIIHDSKIKRLTVADLDQFFKFRQQDSNIDRLDIF